jgi:valyl-tRNA synthetase
MPVSSPLARAKPLINPEYWQKWYPADFISESFPGQFRNWFYSLLAQSTVLSDKPPFKNLFGYATLFAEDGREMHKSWGNSIEFNEAAERWAPTPCAGSTPVANRSKTSSLASTKGTKPAAVSSSRCGMCILFRHLCPVG